MSLDKSILQYIYYPRCKNDICICGAFNRDWTTKFCKKQKKFVKVLRTLFHTEDCKLRKTIVGKNITEDTLRRILNERKTTKKDIEELFDRIGEERKKMCSTDIIKTKKELVERFIEIWKTNCWQWGIDEGMERQMNATNIISNWFLESKYNPQYKYCRDRVELLYDMEFNYEGKPRVLQKKRRLVIVK